MARNRSIAAMRPPHVSLQKREQRIASLLALGALRAAAAASGREQDSERTGEERPDPVRSSTSQVQSGAPDPARR